jgi:acyl carrier protein phosphodiesterase
VNYLAHVFLSRQSPDFLVGALLGDFVKGSIDGLPYAPQVCEAIALHRAIDRYTDAHPIPRASRALISPARRRFGAILVDVFYDHFLARHWHDYCERPLPVFVREVYTALLACHERLPPRLRMVAPRMAADDWLQAYADCRGIHAAVNGIARRLGHRPRAAALQGGGEELERNYAALETHFHEFFPQLIRHVDACARPTHRPAPAAALLASHATEKLP